MVMWVAAAVAPLPQPPHAFEHVQTCAILVASASPSAPRETRVRTIMLDALELEELVLTFGVSQLCNQEEGCWHFLPSRPAELEYDCITPSLLPPSTRQGTFFQSTSTQSRYLPMPMRFSGPCSSYGMGISAELPVQMTSADCSCVLAIDQPE